MPKFCCHMMEVHSTLSCKQHQWPHECPDVLVTAGSEDVGIIVHDGGNSFIKINYCPWCGQRAFPPSKILGKEVAEVHLDDDGQPKNIVTTCIKCGKDVVTSFPPPMDWDQLCASCKPGT